MKKILIKVGAVLIFLFLIIEVSLRITCYQKLRERHFPVIFEPDSIVGYRFIPGAKDFKSNPAFYNDHISINSHGYNGKEFTTKKTEDIFRIIFVGSSDECGFETDGPDTYVSLMNEMFKKDDHKVELISCSVDGGFRDKERLDLIKQEIKEYDADIVFISTNLPIRSNFSYRSCYKNYVLQYFNDNVLGDMKKYVDERHDNFSITKVIFKTSFLFRYICKYYVESDGSISKKLESIPLFKDETFVNELVLGNEINFQQGKQQSRKYFDVNKTIQEYEEVIDTLSNYNSELIFYNRFSDNSIRKAFLSDIGIKYLGANIKYTEDCTFGEINEHSTQIGHWKSANVFYKKILESNIIPSQYLSNNNSNINSKYEDVIKNNTIESTIEFGTKDKETFDILVLHNELEGIQEYLDKMKVNANNELSISCFKIQAEEYKLDDYLRLKKYDMIFVPLPFEVFNINYNNYINKVHALNIQLQKNEVKLFFYYDCNNTTITNNINNNKRILEYLLSKQSISCLQVRIQESEMRLKEFKQNDFKKIISVKHSNIFFNQIIEDVGSSNILADTSVSFELRSSSTTTIPMYDLTKLVDKNKFYLSKWATGWLSDTLNSHYNHEEWISFNFNEVQTINRLILYPISYSNAIGNGYPEEFEIQTSLNGVAWTTIKKIVNIQKPGIFDEQVYNFEEIETKHFRIIATKLRKDRYEDGDFFRLGFSEIELYGN